MNDKKEIEIYVATDSEGLVLYSQEITEEHLCLNLQKMLRRIDMKCKDYRVRLIAVHSTDNIIGKHWTDVDLRERRLKECHVNYFEYGKRDVSLRFFKDKWVLNGDRMLYYPDLSSALSQLIPLTSE